jgi:glutamate-5-semialdehyde dehydrogenase
MLADMGKQVKVAAGRIARASTGQKNGAILALAELLDQQADDLMKANAFDVAAARTKGLAEPLLDRLTLTPKRLAGMAADLRCVAALPDPVGEAFDATTLPNGLRLRKQRVPIGVLGVIYEARPNVTIDIAGLAIKTGNGVLLRGGSETIRSNQALVQLVRRALESAGLPGDAIQFIDQPDRALVLEMMRMDDCIDIIIPRGGAGLHKFCKENSRIPVITGGVGICHIFVDASAKQALSLEVIHNAKTQRPSVCNALDTVLVDRTIAPEILPAIVHRLAPSGVTFRAHESAVSFLMGQATVVSSDTSQQKAVWDGLDHPALLDGVSQAGPDDFDTEWMSLILGLKVVDSLDEAIEHINAHSLHHSDSILTENRAHAEQFMAEVDSCAVYVNASTRFTDGGEFGLGAEVAISTQRLHARGPMGLRELTTYKWVAEGDYHVRPD